MREYRYFAPESLDELFQLCETQAGAEVRFLGGGTDLVPQTNMERDQVPFEKKPPMTIIALEKLGLSGISECDDAIVIGATTKIVDLQDSSLLRQRTPGLCEACDVLASFAIRNAATLGGNIMNASPAGDSLPALLVLDADVTLRSITGCRKIKLADFLVGPGKTAIASNEVLTEVTVYPGSGKSAFKKLGRRAAETLSVINAAAYIEIENNVCTKARVAVGSAAPTPRLCFAAAAELIGKSLTEETVKDAMEKVNAVLTPIDDIRATAWYRHETAPVMAARAVLAAAGIA